MASLNDCRFDALVALGHTGATNDMILQWAVANGATSSHLNDAVLEALLANGATTSHITDAWVEALIDIGCRGARGDMEKKFWCVGGGVFEVIGGIIDPDTLDSIVDPQDLNIYITDPI